MQELLQRGIKELRMMKVCFFGSWGVGFLCRCMVWLGGVRWVGVEEGVGDDTLLGGGGWIAVVMGEGQMLDRIWEV